MKNVVLITKHCLSLTICLIFTSAVFGQKDKEDQIVNANEYPIECITAPEGFVKAKGVNGYVHWSTKSSILVTLVPNKNIVDAEEAFNEEYFNREGVSLISKEKIKTDTGEDALLYKMSFVIKEERWFRYSIFLGELNNVLWINGSYPAKYESVVETSIIESLKTTKFLAK